MTAAQVVSLSPEEWQDYRQLRLEALVADPQAFGARHADMLEQPPSFWQDRLANAQERKKNWLLFARLDNQLVGMVGAFATGIPGVVEIVAVYVSPEHRGHGIGSQLMSAILAEVEREGAFQKVVLGVNQSQAAAIALYHRFGFSVVREQIITLEDGEIRRGCYMEKDLPNPQAASG
jgi:ribosomal protein S18 acetylase RimI-like enzyme